ncbi:hypothetical protein ACFPK9_06905 [Rubritalea spongiae]|uniref:Peptidase C39-like domain-containing protein n=1 Tax=Rubritalea spongiae TaxID=430797 RepID=A0ABW5E242_9BACT
MKRGLWLLLVLVGMTSCAAPIKVTTIPRNQAVIDAINTMPKGGGYSTQPVAHTALSHSIAVDAKGLCLAPQKACPSYCSGATYLVLLEMVKAAEARGEFKLSEGEASALLMTGQADGVNAWGRWNANGPGAAKMIHDLKIGDNFESYAKAQPGDFMKIFWTEEIGKYEHGHLVIYLGSYRHNGVDYVRFWSSNQPKGYGMKSVPKSSIMWAIFSRITKLENIKRVDSLSYQDSFLADMLTRKFSRAEVRSKVF